MLKFISFVLVIGFMMVFGSENLLAAEANDAEMYPSFQVSMFPQTYLKKVTDVENKAQKRKKPPLRYKRIPGEILAGGLGGFAGGFAGGCIGGGVGVLIGYPLGSTSGVYAAGSRDNETGSYLATFIGSIAGFFGGFFGGGLVGGYMEMGQGAMLTAAWGALVGAPICATIGFNLTRRYKSSPASETSLINFRESQMSLAVPTIYPRPDSPGEITQRVDVVRVRF